MNLRYYLRGLGIGIAVTAVVMGFSLNNRAESVMSDEEIIARAETLGMVMEDKLLIRQENDVAKEEQQNESTDVVMQPLSDSVPSSANETENIENDSSDINDENAESSASDSEAKDEKAAEEAAKKKAEEVAAKKKAEEEAAAKKKAEEEAAAKKKAEEEAAAKKKAEEEAAAKKKAEEETKKKEAASIARDAVVVVDVKPGSGSETVSSQLYKAGLVDSATSFNAYLCSGGYDKRLTTGPHNVPVGASYSEIAKIMTR